MEMIWSPDLEVALFHSMHGHKPAGKLTVILNLHPGFLVLSLALGEALCFHGYMLTHRER